MVPSLRGHHLWVLTSPWRCHWFWSPFRGTPCPQKLTPTLRCQHPQGYDSLLETHLEELIPSAICHCLQVPNSLIEVPFPRDHDFILETDAGLAHVVHSLHNNFRSYLKPALADRMNEMFSLKNLVAVNGLRHVLRIVPCSMLIIAIPRSMSCSKRKKSAFCIRFSRFAATLSRWSSCRTISAKYKLPKFQKYDVRKGNTKEHVVDFLD